MPRTVPRQQLRRDRLVADPCLPTTAPVPPGRCELIEFSRRPRKAKPRRSLDPEVLFCANEPTFRSGKAASPWVGCASGARQPTSYCTTMQAIMPTTRETILSALHALLQTQPAPVLRGEVLPERVPAAGLLILRDGDPGEPSVTLSPLRYHYQHRAEVEAVVQTGHRPRRGLRRAGRRRWHGPRGRPHARRALRLGRGRGAAAGRSRHRRRGDAEGRRHPDRAALRERRPARLNPANTKDTRHGTRAGRAGADGARVRDGLRHGAGQRLHPGAVRQHLARLRAAADQLGAPRLRPRPDRADQGRGDRRRRRRRADRRGGLRLLAEGGVRRADHQRRRPLDARVPLGQLDAAVAVDRDGDARGAALRDVLGLRARPAQLAAAALGAADGDREAGGAGRGGGDDHRRRHARRSRR